MKLKTIKLFIAVLCVLLFGVGNAMAGTLKVAQDGLEEYKIYDSDVTDIRLPNQVTIDGKSTGTLSYNSNAHKLTFNNVHRTSSLLIINGWRTFFLYDYTTPLTIELVGDNELTVEQAFANYARLFFGNIKIVGDGSLKLNLKSSRSDNTSSLCVVDGEVDMQGTGVVEMTLSNYNRLDYDRTYAATGVKLQEGMMLSNRSYATTTTKETELIQYVYRENGGLNFGRSGNNAIWLRIEPLKKYNLYIAGQQVNWINMKDVLGDGHVSYDPTNNQVRLSNADIHYEYNGSGYKPDVFNYSYIDYPNEHITGIDATTFKVELKGRNTVTGVVNIATGASFCGFMQNCTFVGDGTLEMDLSANVEAPGVYGFSTQGSGRNKSVTLDPSFTGWVSVSASNVGSKPAAVFETADCQLILPNTTDYFVAKSSTLPVVALTPATINTNLYVAHVNFGYKGASAAPTATITNQNLLTGTAYVGKKLDDETCGLSVTGGQAPFYYTATNLQNGLSINPETGFVSGTYTTATSAISLAKTTTITATDVQGRQTSVSVTRQAVAEKLTINGAITVEPKWAQGIAIEQISLSEKISGGLAPYTYKVLDATSILGNTRLPAGLLLNSSTGVISGTPTAKGAYKCAIEVTDALGQKAGVLVQGNVAINYGFLVAGVPVTGLNKNNIPVSGKTSGTLSYDPATETLVFDNVRAYTTSASTPYFVDSKISKINVVGDNRITYTGSTISGVSEYYGFPGDLDIYGDGQFNFASGRNGQDSYAVNGNVTVKDNATILLFSYYAAVNGTLTVPMNQVIYTADRSGSSAGEWTMLNGVTENVSNYTNKYVKTEILANGALCFTNEKEGKTIYNTIPVKPFTMFDVKGGVAPYSYSATSLPSGLVIDAETGYISGTSTLGNKDVTVNFAVTDAMGREVSIDMNLTLKDPTLNLTKCGGSRDEHFDVSSWTTAANTSLEVGQILLVKSNFDLDETAIEVPKNIVLRDVNGKMLAGNIDLKDGVKYAFPYEVETQSISYTRSFSESQKGKWQALYVPFAFNVADYAEDFDVAEIYALCPTKDTNGDGVVDAEDDKVMILSFVKNGDTQANAPYMIRPKKAAKVTIESENELLHKATINSVEFSTSRTKYAVNGIYSTFVATPGDHNYYMGGGKVSWATTANISVSPNRWYMHEESKSYIGNDTGIDSESKPISIHVIGEDFDEATAIRLINAEFDLSNSNTGIYNLNGMKMNEAGKLPCGIYIKNGKKVIIK